MCLSACEYAMVPDVYILLSPLERGAPFYLRAKMYTFSSKSIKIFKPLSPTVLLWQGHCWIGKNTNKEFKCVDGTCSLAKYRFEIRICFWFQLKSPSNIFLKFGKFLVLYLGCGFMTFNFRTHDDFTSPLTHVHELIAWV